MLRLSLHRLLWPLADRWRWLRRAAKDRMPYVRRRQYRILQARYAALADAVHRGLTRAVDVPVEVRKAPGALTGSVCLFVTHAGAAQLKSHVAHHIEHLLRRGLQVVLVANTDLPPAGFQVPEPLASRLAGIVVRANRGFDFAAWAHALSLLDSSGWERLYLVNDSIVGPVDAAAFDAMMDTIARSDADVIGLTENPVPMPHLQSYFLVLGRRALASDAFRRLVHGVHNFEDKALVIEVYELRTTRTLAEAGLGTRAIFQTLADGRGARGDLHGRWEVLLDSGFPYVKTSVMQRLARHPRMLEIREAARVDAQV